MADPAPPLPHARTRMVLLQTPQGADPIIQVHRELTVTDAEGEVFSRPDRIVTRKLGAVAAQTISLPDGTVLTPVQVAQAVSLFCDRWAAE